MKVDPDKSFLELNPEFKTIKFFKKLSSDKLNAIALLEHPDSPLQSIPREERIEEVLSSYNFEYKDIEDSVSEFLKYTISPLERLLLNWKSKLEERDKYLLETPYNENTAELQDKLLSNSEKIWKQYLNIENQVFKEKQEAGNRGGYEESLIEKL